jgi:hypothetical protein
MQQGTLPHPGSQRQFGGHVSSLGKSLIVIGLVVALIGVLLSFAGRIPWLGRLPGDIYVKRENFTFYFPLATSIIVSLLLSFILWLFRK